MGEWERLRRLMSGEQRRNFDLLKRVVDKTAAATIPESRAALAPRGLPGTVGLPEGDQDLLELVRATEAEAICLAQMVPSDPAATSFVGGLPIVSEKFVWPRSAGASGYAPNSFIAQVDCSTLPAFRDRQLLPNDGRLCFFVDWDIFESRKKREGEHPGLVVHDQGSAIRVVQEPPDLPHLFGIGARYRFPWLNAVGEYPKTFTKWQITPHAIRTYADESYVRPDGASEVRYRTVRDGLLDEQVRALFGEPIVLPRRDQLRDELNPPTQLFPEYWLQLQVFFGEYAEKLGREIEGGTRQRSSWPADLQGLRRTYELLHEEVLALLIESREQDAFSPVPPPVRAGFWDWCMKKAGQIESVHEAKTFDLRSPYTLNELFRVTHWRTGPEIVSRLGSDTLYGSDVIDLVRHSRSTRHQMLGHAHNIGSAEMRLGQSRVLLAEFASEASPWQWGDLNHLQYWVELDDLKARRFDRVEIAIA